ncbi:hypothetical protein P7K49_031813 [Saguinus oedipus]|uniref:Uncharacterized protein n=1 Tax=Saguinus oedipus TaxID=9490 RepID=A0ABQ9U0H9_SAGOE|nr:hypothetical protein P7K49_031813 [Saguinus oedipus]
MNAIITQFGCQKIIQNYVDFSKYPHNDLHLLKDICFKEGGLQIFVERARSCLTYLVSQLANMEHSFHHILLLEIKSITDTFSSILGPQSRDIFRMSNSFTAIAKLLTRQLENVKAGSSSILKKHFLEAEVILYDKGCVTRKITLGDADEVIGRDQRMVGSTEWTKESNFFLKAMRSDCGASYMAGDVCTGAGVSFL